MAQNETAQPLHPGVHIKTKVLPPDLSVKAAAELLGVGRPALSNLLNGNAAVSPEMALRLEKTFGSSQKELLQMQAEFDLYQTKDTDKSGQRYRTMGPWKSQSSINAVCFAQEADPLNG